MSSRVFIHHPPTPALTDHVTHDLWTRSLRDGNRRGTNVSCGLYRNINDAIGWEGLTLGRKPSSRDVGKRVFSVNDESCQLLLFFFNIPRRTCAPPSRLPIFLID